MVYESGHHDIFSVDQVAVRHDHAVHPKRDYFVVVFESTYHKVCLFLDQEAVNINI